MTRPDRSSGDSSWFIDDHAGFAWLPSCSGDYQASSIWQDTCLTDPVGTICQRHHNFFRTRKVAVRD